MTNQRMLAKITKSYQFESQRHMDYEKFVSGSFDAIMKHAHMICGPDTEEAHTIEFNEMKDENEISLVHWVSESSTYTNEKGEPEEQPEHYWKFALTVHFVADVVEECKDEVVAI